MSYWARLESRLAEMAERRLRLNKYIYKKEGRLADFEEDFRLSILKKQQIIRKFTSIQLEDLLRTSTKNVAQEVVSCLIPSNFGKGILVEIERSGGYVAPNKNLMSEQKKSSHRQEEQFEEQSSIHSDGVGNRSFNLR